MAFCDPAVRRAKALTVMCSFLIWTAGITGVAAGQSQPQNARTTSGCDYDPNKPLVGCWLAVTSTDVRIIWNIKRNGDFYLGNIEQLETGQPVEQGRYENLTDQNWLRFYEINPSKRFPSEYLFVLPIGYSTQCTVMDLVSSGGNNHHFYTRVKPLHITQFDFSPQLKRNKIKESMNEGQNFNNCPDVINDRYFPDILDDVLWAFPVSKAPEILRFAFARRATLFAARHLERNPEKYSELLDAFKSRLPEVLEGDVAAEADTNSVLPTIPLSRSRFGHTFDTHGQDATEFLTNRARATGKPDGQFLNDQAAARFIQENLNKIKGGPVSFPMPEGFPARMINPDGTFSPARTIRLVPGGKGVKTAYPE